MSTSSERAAAERIREHQQRAAIRIADQLVGVGRRIGLTDEQITETVADPAVRRSVEHALRMRVRSDTTWRFVAEMLPGTFRRANASYDPFARIS